MYFHKEYIMEKNVTSFIKYIPRLQCHVKAQQTQFVMSKHNKHSSGKMMCDKHEQIQNMKTNVFLILAIVYTQ
jgi:hypothetical protein